MKKTLADFQPLKPAEKKLLECCQRGEFALIGEERPTEKTKANEIRAEFLRWLILFSKVNIDPYGIQFKGAWISGMLDLENAHSSSVLGFFNSIFEEELFLRSATTKNIYLDGSLFKRGIEANRLLCQGNLHLRNGFSSEGKVCLSGAKIDGTFSCKQGSFKALTCDGITIGKSLHISDGFSAEGEVCFVKAKVEGHFACDGGVFKALAEDENALKCDGMQVGGGLLLRAGCLFYGGIDLTHVTVSALSYDETFLEQEGLKEIKLDGFKYGHIYNSDIKASFLLKNMLGKMREFKPQPYKQLAKVFRDMGHNQNANEVMIALHDRYLEIQKNESTLYFIFQILYKWTSSYGYRPMRLVAILMCIWISFGFLYWYGASVAVFAPSNPLIFQKDYNCTINTQGTPLGALPKDYNASNNWYYATPPEYSTFQPFWYSLDIFLPTIDLQLERDWGVVIPSPKGNWTDMSAFFTTNDDDNEIIFIINYLFRFCVWIEAILGWLVGLGIVALVSGQLKIVKD